MYLERRRTAGCLATSCGFIVTAVLGVILFALTLPSINTLAYQAVINSGSSVSLDAARLQVIITNPLMVCGGLIGFFVAWVILANVIQHMMDGGGRRGGINRRAVIHVDEYIEPY